MSTMFAPNIVDKLSSVTRQMLKCYDMFGLLFQEFLLNTFQSKNVGVKSVCTKVEV